MRENSGEDKAALAAEDEYFIPYGDVNLSRAADAFDRRVTCSARQA